MINRLSIFIAVWVVALASVTDVAAKTEKSDYTPEQALEFSQAAVGRHVGDFTFTDSQGETVHMTDFLGKPLVISYIYTSCQDSCPVITQTLADAVSVARDALGADSFNVISMGFDAGSDNPDRLRYFASQNDIDVSGWKFLSGDLATTLAFSDNLGFIFYRSPKGFDHLSQVTVVDAKGTVYRQIYGQTFETPLLVEPLKELVFGTSAPFASIGDLIKKVRLFCTIYDPAADRYRFDYSIFIQLIVGTLVVGSMGVFVVREWWRIFRRRRRVVKQQTRHPTT
ncbi:MAG: SCO family protein [Rhodospirillaceae bacterium]|nr:SCO family protein [Rhodospirillaceae bacterium]